MKMIVDAEREAEGTVIHHEQQQRLIMKQIEENE